MTSATRPASLEYFGSRTQHTPTNNFAEFHNPFNRVRNILHSIGNTAGAVYFGLRQEVPFERWFFDHGFQFPLDKPMDQITARAWAVVATCESLVRAAAEVVSRIYSFAFDPTNSHRHLAVLKMQTRSLCLSMLAIISPNWAKEVAYNAGGESLIGASIFNWKWGTLYTGKVDAPFWKIECSCYPWVDWPQRA